MGEKIEIETRLIRIIRFFLCIVHILRTILNESLATNDEALFIFIWFATSKSGNFDCWLLIASY